MGSVTEMARAAAKRKPKSRKGKRSKRAVAERGLIWASATLTVVATMLCLRLIINALELVPVHFDEAQYWAYGQELAWGYFSKPPLVGAIIRLTTEIGGDTLFWLRIASPVSHALIAGIIFLIGRKIWNSQTGFWAAAGYTLAPGVDASAMLISTDPIMMVTWAAALYAMIRGLETRQIKWWIAVGALIGFGMLAKYTAVAFFAGVLGYLLFSTNDRDWKGAGAAFLAAAIVFSPNFFWNVANNFSTISHVAEDADPGKGYLNVGKLAEFLGAQLGVIGPVFFAAIGLGFWRWREWSGDAVMRLMAWQTGGLLIPIVLLSFLTRAQPNWSAPAYIAGSLFAARWLVSQEWKRGLWLQIGTGALASIALWAAAFVYQERALELARKYDPFKKMRIAEPFCEIALGTMGEEGAQVLLSDNRRRLSECMFMGGLGWDEVAVWNPELTPKNHHELVVTLRPGDDRLMLLAIHGRGRPLAKRFEEAREIDVGVFSTHADREVPYSIWVVQGFKGYR